MSFNNRNSSLEISFSVLLFLLPTDVMPEAAMFGVIDDTCFVLFCSLVFATTSGFATASLGVSALVLFILALFSSGLLSNGISDCAVGEGKEVVGSKEELPNVVSSDGKFRFLF